MPHPLLLKLLQAAETYAPGHSPLRHLEVIPGQTGRSRPWPDWVDENVVGAFTSAGIHQPWEHQHRAWEILRAGKHLALATETGSGKSLVAWVPVLSALQERPSGRISDHSRPATAVYLSPTKALGNDQAEKLRNILDSRSSSTRFPHVTVAVADGDASPAERSWAQRHADVVFTNPDFLHHSLLPGAGRWGRLLRGLRYIIVDELHSYRGMVGAHVSLVVRRLMRLAARAGAAPQVIVASATATTPTQTLATFLGVNIAEVGAVTASSAPRGTRVVAMWEPPDARDGKLFIEDEDIASSEQAPATEGGTKKSALTETADLLATLVGAGASTLAFTRGRAGAEAVADMVRERVPIEKHASIAAYRGGYLPEERRVIERALHKRELLAVATTSALEMGVDIASLDAVIIAGWPGTRASFWQQAGRAGRAGHEGLAVFVASEDVLDHYLLSHPEHVLGTPVEATTFDPTNPHVLAPHLCAAAAEAPLTEEDLQRFSLPDTALLEELTARGLLRRRTSGWYWNYDQPMRPHALTDLRGSAGREVSVVEHGTGRVVGTVDAARADAVVHPGAIYVHQGQAYSVIEMEEDVAVVVATTEQIRTRAHSRTRVEILQVTDTFTAGPLTWNYGLVHVHSQVTSFEQRRLPTLEVLGGYALDMPERALRTRSVWWSIPAQDLLGAGVPEVDIPGALHAAEHALIALLGVVATCDRWDLGGLSTAIHESSLAPTVFVHDAFPGGSGFAHRGFTAAEHWVKATLDAVRGCPCEIGCPRCIQSPKCGNGNNPLNKRGAVATLALLFDHLTTSAPRGR